MTIVDHLGFRIIWFERRGVFLEAGRLSISAAEYRLQSCCVICNRTRRVREGSIIEIEVQVQSVRLCVFITSTTDTFVRIREDVVGAVS